MSGPQFTGKKKEGKRKEVHVESYCYTHFCVSFEIQEHSSDSKAQDYAVNVSIANKELFLNEE